MTRARVFTIKLIYQGGGPQDGFSETIEIDPSQEGQFIERRYPIERKRCEHVYQSGKAWDRSQKEVILSYLGPL